jgi:hypothetical protein
MTTFSLFGGHYSLVVVVITLAITGIAGAVIGADQAAAGGEPIDLFEMLHEEMFTEDGELRERDLSKTQPGVIRAFNERVDHVSPDTPRVDRLVRQQLLKPLVLASFHVADAGSRIGYAMATTLGLGVTKLLLNGAVGGMLGGVLFYSVSVTRRAAR